MPSDEISPDVAHLDQSLEPQLAPDQRLADSGFSSEPSSPLFRSSPNESDHYSLRKQNGQLIYGGPPPDWTGPPPTKGSEVFVGKIPREFGVDDLVPIFSRIGKIYELRLLTDFSECNRGYGFVRYTSIEAARKAVRMLNDFQIAPNRYIGVMMSEDNRRLWICPIPENFSLEQIKKTLDNLTPGVKTVTLNCSRARHGRHYAIVEYESHRAASLARRVLIPGNSLFDQRRTEIEWAKSRREADRDLDSLICSLFVRNVSEDTTADQLCDIFSKLCRDQVRRVDKTRDYAFVHFTSHQAAKNALETARKSNFRIDRTKVGVSWSHHPEFKLNKKRRSPMTFTAFPKPKYHTQPQISNYPIPPPPIVPYQPWYPIPMYGVFYGAANQYRAPGITSESQSVPSSPDSNLQRSSAEGSPPQGPSGNNSTLLIQTAPQQGFCGNPPIFDSRFLGPASIRPNVVVFAPMRPNYSPAVQPSIGASHVPTDQVAASCGSSSGYNQMRASYGSTGPSHMGASYGSTGHSHMGTSYGSVSSPVDPNCSMYPYMDHQVSKDGSPTTSAENPDCQLFFGEQSLTSNNY